MEIGLRPAEPVDGTTKATIAAGEVCEKIAVQRPRRPVKAANAALGRQNTSEERLRMPISSPTHDTAKRFPRENLNALPISRLFWGQAASSADELQVEWSRHRSR
jgi:hypothetical protein